jgi:MoxR-like ATPase
MASDIYGDNRKRIKALIENIGKAVVGKDDAVELMLVALLCEGHVLIEDMPGVGKTLLAKTLAHSMGLEFRRIQFTPDLLPSDVTGSLVFNQQRSEFEFRPGPIFAQIVLSDEINRATPRTQSALLEAMEEFQVTTDGVTRPLDRPFMVLATQNPIELEGTFPLPEAQLDRFLLRITLGYPTSDEEEQILLRFADNPADIQPVFFKEDLIHMKNLMHEIHISDDVRRYLVTLVQTTRDWSGVMIGGSPRASLALYRSARALACLRGRTYVLPDDIKYLAPAVLGHRILLTSQARATGQDTLGIISDILQKIPVPAENFTEKGTAHA